LSLLPGRDRLRDDLAQLGVALEPSGLAQLEGFAALLERWNRRFNLLSRQDLARLWPRHILDSLSIQDLLHGETLDVGSGGGFPGVPLAVARADLNFRLVDRNERKCRFLELAVSSLGLANVSVRCADAAALTPELDGRFACIVSRAVADVGSLARLATPLLAPGGHLVCMTSTRGEASQAPACAHREIRRIPGLELPHEVVIIERPAADELGNKGR